MTDDITRRDVLRGLGGLALAGTVGCGEREPEPTGEFDQSIQACAAATIASVANKAVAVSKVEAYAQKSVAAGETIDFRVSSPVPVPYQLSIVRLGWDTDSPTNDTMMPVGDCTLYTFPQANASQQLIRPGSYIHVETALNPTTTFLQLTLECWARPFRTISGSNWQGLLSQHTYPNQCGFILGLTDANVPFYYFGNGGQLLVNPVPTAPGSISALEWHHLVAVFNAGAAQLYVDGVQVASASGFPTVVTPGSAPLRIGAYGDATGTSYFYDGDLAMPVIYSRALSASEIATRAGVKPPQAPTDSAVIGCWPLDEERGANVADVSGCGRTGTIVNRGTWMIGGPGFDAASVDRYAPYNPDTDPTRGHGLRLSWTDLYDCGWLNSNNQSYTLPSDCLPGIYVGRIIYTDNFTDPNKPVTRRYDVTFVVRLATIRPYAPVLVLCATNTWHAYNNAFQLHSFYDNHASGQPTYYQGFEMPWTFSTTDPAEGGFPGGADPYLRYSNNNNPNYSHLVRAERLLHVWLENNGYDYDVISDRDLDSNRSILSNYQTVFIAGHSEYWTSGAWGAVRSYVASGGNLISASGNTMFRRVSYDNSVIECRKVPSNMKDHGSPCDWLYCGGVSGTITSSSREQWGEVYHEHDHQRGGLMRESGYPAWQVTGLDTAGMDASAFPYVVTNPEHPLFQTPEPVRFGSDMQLGGMYAVAHEWDATVTSLLLAPSAAPPFPSVPPDYKPSQLAQAQVTVGLDYHCNWYDVPLGPVGSEIVEWVWSSGGRVFSAGSIAAGQALHVDENMAALFRNALHANGVVFKLNVLAIGQDGHFGLKSFDGSAWSTGWDDQGAPGAGFLSSPTGVQWAPNSLAAMAIATDGHFYYKYNVGSDWSPWNDYGSAPFAGRPVAVGWGRNRLELFARGNGQVWQKSWDGSAFTDWIGLGGSDAGDPAAVSWQGPGRLLSVAVLNSSGNPLYRVNINGTWSGWNNLGGVFTSAPTMVFSGGKRLTLFAVDAAGVLWMNYADPSTGYGWSGWSNLGAPSGGLAGRVQVACWGGPDSFTVFGIGHDGHLYAIYWNGSAWGPWWDGGGSLGGSLVGEPSVASFRGSYISVLCVASNGHVQHRLWNGSTREWEAWQDFGGAMRQSPAVFRSVGT